jgi:hypothetical protein
MAGSPGLDDDILILDRLMIIGHPQAEALPTIL